MISPANIQEDEHGIPYSTDYNDCYYSRNNGLAESRYVFQEGNQLIERWQARETPYHTFVIAETGFGTGLNFLATWKTWHHTEKKNRPKILHFISIEKHPIPKSQLVRILSYWDELSPFSNKLLESYPPLITGLHRLAFDNHQVILTLCFMPAKQALASLHYTIDAWYLDGFAPAKNPDLWDQETLSAIAKLSHKNTTLATFTAASLVRKQLINVGFKVSKRKGFAKKREMLVAQFTNNEDFEKSKKYPTIKAWFNYSALKRHPSKHVVIIGGGIAACQAAWHLAQRGWQVTLLERHADLAQEASGNLAGVISPKMTAKPSIGEDFYLASFLYVLQQLQQFAHTVDWDNCGLLQLVHNKREKARWEALKTREIPESFLKLLDKKQASELANIDLDYSANYFPKSAWVNPKSFCKRLTQHSNITIQYYHEALHLEKNNNAWHITGRNKALSTPLIIKSAYVIIANGKEAQQFSQNRHLPFMPVAGQSSLAKSNTYSKNLSCILGHEGYFIPDYKGLHCFGATFNRNSIDSSLNSEKTDENFLQAQKYLPNIGITRTDCENGHAAVRMATPDRFPYVGALPNIDYYQKHYSDLHQGKYWKDYPPANYLNGLFIFAGFGSRGLTTTALCAEMLAALLNNEPLPFENKLLNQLHPARFLIRQLKKQSNKTDRS
jgi:tRNA 5-methylaminomethyl-2-thiouridine biosynthesis bifunctional protein